MGTEICSPSGTHDLNGCGSLSFVILPFPTTEKSMLWGLKLTGNDVSDEGPAEV